MSNTAFYIFALAAIIVAALTMKHIVSCAMRIVVVVVLAVVLAAVYYFFVGQYDPEMHDAVESALEKYDVHLKR